MSDNKPIKKISKRYFTFFGGIAFCLIAVILILNGKVFARAIAFPFAFAFGMASYVLYILVYSYGLSLFFREKGFKIRLNNYFFGGLIIFISVLMIATLIARTGKVVGTNEQLATLTLGNFVNEFKSVFAHIDGGKFGDPDEINFLTPYWQSVMPNLFINPFGGGICGYFLVALISTPFKTTGTWVIAVLIFLIGAFVVFFPAIKKIITKDKEPKAKKEKQEREVYQERRIENYDAISSASDLDDINTQPSPIIAQPQSSVNKPADFDSRKDIPAYNQPYPQTSSAFAGSTNFVPARFSKYMPKPQPQEVAPQQERISGAQALLEANRQSTINEQMSLNFDEKPQIDDSLAMAKPEFVEPVNVARVRPVQQQPVAPQPAPVIDSPVVRKPIKWVPPSTELLETLEVQDVIDLNNQVANERMEKINQLFEDFHIQARCNSYIVGPSVTRYNIDYSSNVSVKSVEARTEDLARHLGGVAARFEGVVAGQTYSGLEVPNAKITAVSFKEVYEQLPDSKKHPLAVAFGKAIDNKVVNADFNDFPHVLVAGTTGSGKSVFTHSVICTLIMRNSPENLKLILIDPKKVEMSKYRDIPHLLCPIINDANTAKLTLSKLVDEMNRRYEVLDINGCSDIKQYNELKEEKPDLENLPYIVVFIDEYADLVDVCKDMSQPVVSIAQKARAAGIHMLIATQRPSTNVITGVIKGNLPTRVALAVASQVDSVTILNEGGAEKLLGRGDMLVQSPLISRVGMARLQSCFIQNKEILHVVGYLKEHYECVYNPEFCNLVDAATQNAKDVVGSPEFMQAQDNSEQAKYEAIKEYVMANEYMSMSRIQRDCGVGFNRAGRVFKQLQEEGIIAWETEGNKGCPVLVHDKFYDGSPDTDVAVSSDQSELN